MKEKSLVILFMFSVLHTIDINNKLEHH